MLQKWLTQQRGVSDNGVMYFELNEDKILCNYITLDPNNNKCANILRFLRDLLIDSRINEKILTDCVTDQKLRHTPKEILSAIIPSNQNMMNAEFGEVLTEAILELIHKYEIPIKKRRYAIHGNQSLPSHDTLALKVKNNKIVEMCFIESKLRNHKDYAAPTEAFYQLKQKYSVNLPEILIFNLQRMDELNHPLYLAFKEYLRNRTPGQNVDSFWIGLTWDIDCWRDSMLNNLKVATSTDLPKTNIHLVKIKDLEKIICHLFAQVRAKYA